MSMVFLDQLKTWYPRYDYKIEVQPDFVATHPISVYKKAADIMGGLITSNKSALIWNLTQIELTKSRDQFVTPEGPVFLDFSPN
ncbi:hypothetical protein GCM10028816_52740 [Spirosoma lituiforme]